MKTKKIGLSLGMFLLGIPLIAGAEQDDWTQAITKSAASAVQPFKNKMALLDVQRDFRSIYGGMPECREKKYMEASMVARAVVDMGGSLTSPTGSAELDSLINYWVSPPPLRDYKGTLEYLVRENEDELARLEPNVHVWIWILLSDPVNDGTNGADPSARAQALDGLNQLKAARQKHAQLMNILDLYKEFMLEEQYWLKQHPGVRN